jgi:hypothetical protein
MAIMPPQENVKYAAARALVEALEALCPNAVRRLREEQP